MAYKPRSIWAMHRSEALEAVLEAASEQGGYVTAGQATRLGLARDDVARLVGFGDLQRVRRAVFRMRHAHEQHEDDIAAWLHFERDRLPWERRGETNVVLSHDSAAALRRLGTIIPARPVVTLLASGRSPHVKDIDVRRASLRAEDWAWLDVGAIKLPVTTPARTIVDLLLDKQEPSYIERAATEALAERVTTRAEIMDAARHRKSRTAALEARTASLLDLVA
jgi:predicted transcriptional regulator of viral defense system